MTTVNNPQDSSSNSLDAINLELLISTLGKDKKSHGDQKALLLSLSEALEEVMDQANSKAPNSNSKVVTPNFKGAAQAQAKAPNNNTQIPSDASMQQALGELMGLLAQLEGEIAKFGNEKSQLNAKVGTSLINEMSSQVKAAQDQVQKIISEENSPWSWLTKMFECIVAAIVCVVACVCGQPELAAIVLVMTILAVSGGMDKITQGISSLLQDMGVPANVANILASALVIVATIVVTVLTCGAGASAVVEEVADAGAEALEDGIEMTDMGTNTVEDATEETTTEGTQVAEDSEQTTSKWQQFKNGLQKVIDNTFGKLPKNVNLGIVAGSMAVGNTNFAQYIAVEALSNMKDGKEKDALTTLIETIVNLLAAIAGAGAGAAAMGSSVSSELGSNISNALKNGLGSNMGYMMKALQVIGFGAGLAQGGSEGAEGGVQLELANNTRALGDTQAFITALQSLITMNNGQSTNDNKVLSGQLKAHSQELLTLGADAVKEGLAVTQALQA